MSERIDKLVKKVNDRWLSYLSRHVTHPILKYELYSPIGEFDDVVVNRLMPEWEDTQMTFKRNDTSGVFVQATVPISFCREAADILRELFSLHKLRAEVGIRFYIRDNIENTYDLLKETLLDFETYQDDGTVVTMQAVSDEVSELIKSLGNTKYDIAVKDLSDPKKWQYERIDTLSSINYQIPINEDGIPLGFDTLPYVYYGSNEVVPDGVIHEALDQQYSYSYYSTASITPLVELKQSYFFRAHVSEESEITFNIDFGGEITTYQAGTDIKAYIQKTNLQTDPDLQNWQTIEEGIIVPIDIINRRYNLSFPPKFTTMVSNDDVMRLIIVLKPLAERPVGALGELKVYRFNYMNVQWITKGKTLDIDVIDPEVLGQTLLNMIAGNRQGYGLQIYWRNEDYLTLICAAESIRQFSDPYLHGSLKDFIAWMRSLGYEFQYQGKNIIFRERDYFYNADKNTPYLELSERENAEFTIIVSRDHAYTGVKIGYNKKEYNNTNGRFEVNTTFEYTTGYISKDREQILSLISPYRADSMGIEYLCQESLDKTKDTNSDNDIFVVALVDGDTRYMTYRNEDITVNIDEWGESRTITLFNGVFAPSRLVEHNKSLIGINTEILNLTSTDGYRNATADFNLFGDIVIDKKLHEPIKYSINVGSHQRLLVNTVEINNLIKFTSDGKDYYGFIDDIIKNYGMEEEQEWKLYAVE